MATVVPGIKAKFGSTTYYQSIMPAGQLVSVARPASEQDDWAGWSIEERLQRELNSKRISEQISPYMAESADRFFGSIIVLLYKGHIEFEPLEEFKAKIPAGYRHAAEGLGFITIEGGEYIILDGQHRVVAIRDILQGKYNGKATYARELPNDQLSVIFIEYENIEKTRRIFNKVNRNAKPTSRSDNIITSEDDGYAIVARRLLNKDMEGPLAIEYEGQKGELELIVNWKSNTIPTRSNQITTISAVHQTVMDILDYKGIINFDEKTHVNRPSKEALKQAYDLCSKWWSTVLIKVDCYVEATKNPKLVPKMREPDQPYSLLFKPVGTIVLFKSLVRIMQRCREMHGTLHLEDAIDRAEKVDWSISSDIWKEILVRPNLSVITSQQSYSLAANLVAYLVAPEYTTDEQKDTLLKEYNVQRGHDDPDEEGWEPLPNPVV